jgi:hypothetical protein
MRGLVLLLALVAVGISCGGSTPSPLSSTSSTFILSGQVTDSVTGGSVIGASVSVADGLNAGRSATVDALGNYSIPALQQSGFTVTVSAVNYASQSKAVTLTSNQRFRFNSLGQSSTSRVYGLVPGFGSHAQRPGAPSGSVPFLAAVR